MPSTAEQRWRRTTDQRLVYFCHGCNRCDCLKLVFVNGEETVECTNCESRDTLANVLKARR